MVSNPLLVFIVGSFGLLSNILGLFLFHEHGHGHGHSHSHSHSHGAEHGTLVSAEEGLVYGNILTASDHPRSSIHGRVPSAECPSQSEDATEHKADTSHSFDRSDEDNSTVAISSVPISSRKRRHPSLSKPRFSPEDINVHPASFRNDIIAQSQLEDTNSIAESDFETGETVEEAPEPTEHTSLLRRHRSRSESAKQQPNSPSDSSNLVPKPHGASWHQSHKHSQPKKSAKGGGNLNIQGVFLHVMGDALGNVGVMVSAIIIRYWSSPLALYADPAVSLVITAIILTSAIPLCQAASRILLQAVPAGMDVDDIKEDIKELPGILNCHHMHVWQLSDTKLVASLHIEVDYDFKGEGSARYMELAQAVRSCLHGYGIHSSTIQPEFCLDRERYQLNQAFEATGEGSHGESSTADGRNNTSARGSKAASMRGELAACLLECGTECDERGQCCAPGLDKSETRDEVS